MGFLKTFFGSSNSQKESKAIEQMNSLKNMNTETAYNKEFREQKEKEARQLHIEKYKNIVTLLELSDDEVKRSMNDSSYLMKLRNDLIDFEFAVNVLGYSKEDTLRELRTTTGKNKDRPILEIRRIFSWAKDIYGMTNDDSLAVFNDPNQRDKFINEYYAFCDAYQAGLAEQYRSFFEPNIPASQTSTSHTNTNTSNNSHYEEFLGIDGQWYTKNQYGYICKKGSTQIIGQNGYDFDGHQLEYFK